MSWLVGTLNMKIDLGAHLLYGTLSSSYQSKMANLSILGHFGTLFHIFWGFQPIGSTKTNLGIYKWHILFVNTLGN